jgi:tRNA(Ile)-lysidine synthase
VRRLTATDFGVALTGLIGRPLGASERIAVAVSGGPDSLALLLLAHAGFGGRVVALTVDHRMRAASATEAADVAALCAARDIAHVTLTWDGDKPAANLQAQARSARYRLLGDWCAANGVGWCATAHHRDDVAETVLLRLARGAGAGGLATMPARRALVHGVTLLRPLLGATRAELAAVVVGAGLVPVDDPSNHDPRFDRTAARALLAATAWLDPARLSASADHLADAEAALDWAARAAWDSRAVAHTDAVTVDAAGLPRELRRRLAGAALAHLAPAFVPRGEGLDRLLAALDRGRRATLGGIIGTGGSVWRFHFAPKRRI